MDDGVDRGIIVFLAVVVVDVGHGLWNGLTKDADVGRWVLPRKGWGVFGRDGWGGSCQEGLQQDVHPVV